MKIVLVYNPTSGSALTKKVLQEKCTANAISVEAWVKVDDRLESKLGAHVARGAIVAVVGGDGTINTVANLIAGKKAVLAPLPGGTLNHFTKDLGIAQDIDDAFAALSRSRTHVIDVAAVNGRVFINNSSIGLYPSSLRERDKIEATFGKWPAAVVASVRTLVRLRAFTVTIGKETFRTPFVFVGNNEYKLDGIGAPVRTRLDGGVLSIFVAKTVSRWSLLKICLFALVGRARTLNDFEVRKVTSLTIKMKKPHLHVSYDGEVRTFSSPLTYEIRKKALHVRY